MAFDNCTSNKKCTNIHVETLTISKNWIYRTLQKVSDIEKNENCTYIIQLSETIYLYLEKENSYLN